MPFQTAKVGGRAVQRCHALGTNPVVRLDVRVLRGAWVLSGTFIPFRKS